ncbi:MAG: alanine dehydrogenase [Candidatus Omnitrophica bacterium]|nr:alanine dehydrogenase [Candidatus Omnitrophota bacterium]
MPKTKPQTIILNRRAIESVLDLGKALAAVEDAFRQYARGRAHMPPKVYLDVRKYNGDFRAMPAYLEDAQSCTLKWVNVHPGNPAIGLPMVMAVLVLNDARTGFPLSVMDGTYITAVRTGAAGAVAAKHIAPKGAVRVGLVGCGVQAAMQLTMLRLVRSVKEVRVWGHQPQLAKAFLRKMRRRSEDMTACAGVEETVAGADIVVTTTPVRTPIVKYGWIKPGAHINAIGADAAGKQELDPRLLQEGRIIIDEWSQASHSGEINVALKKGLITKRKIYASLGEIVAGQKKIPAKPVRTTVFDSTGLAIQDAAVARLVYDAARRRKVGRRIHLF